MAEGNRKTGTLLVVLFLFFICLFSTTSASRANRLPKYELSAVSHPSYVAISSNLTLYFLESLKPICKRLEFSGFTSNTKIFADKEASHQQLIFLSKVELQVNPILAQGHYLQYLRMDTEDIPPLS